METGCSQLEKIGCLRLIVQSWEHKNETSAQVGVHLDTPENIGWKEPQERKGEH